MAAAAFAKPICCCALARLAARSAWICCRSGCSADDIWAFEIARACLPIPPPLPPLPRPARPEPLAMRPDSLDAVSLNGVLPGGRVTLNPATIGVVLDQP